MQISYHEFLEQIKERLEKKVHTECKVVIGQVVKNNAQKKDYISIMEKDDNMAPVLYLQPFYQMLTEEKSIDEVADEILSFFYEELPHGKWNTDFFLDYERIRKRLACRLIHYERNEEFLKNIPHIKFLDLAVVFYYVMEEEFLEHATILIQNAHRDLWGITDEILYEDAYNSMKMMFGMEFMNIVEAFLTITGKKLDCISEEEMIPMYILTNQVRQFGAAQILYPEVLETIYEKLQSEFYVLPSSVHECIILPAEEELEPDRLREMVKEVNETQVAAEEVLSDQVYRYSKEKGCLIMA